MSPDREPTTYLDRAHHPTGEPEDLATARAIAHVLADAGHLQVVLESVGGHGSVTVPYPSGNPRLVVDVATFAGQQATIVSTFIDSTQSCANMLQSFPRAGDAQRVALGLLCSPSPFVNSMHQVVVSVVEHVEATSSDVAHAQLRRRLVMAGFDPADVLTPAPVGPRIVAQVQLQFWDVHDIAQDAGRPFDLDVTDLVGALPAGARRELADRCAASDDLFHAAVTAGLTAAHNGPFYVLIADSLAEYDQDIACQSR